MKRHTALKPCITWFLGNSSLLSRCRSDKNCISRPSSLTFSVLCPCSNSYTAGTHRGMPVTPTVHQSSSSVSMAVVRTLSMHSLAELKLTVFERHPLLRNCLYLQAGCPLTFKLQFSSKSSAPYTDYYAILGINRKATQEEIKSAYYELSKTYHPDRNKGSIEAAVKFQAVAMAYEILGNYKLRKMYDKGFLPAEYGHEAVVQREEYKHPIEHEAFYRSRSKRHKVPEFGDQREAIFDVDKWTKEQTEKQRQSLIKAKERAQIKAEQRENQEYRTHFEYILLFSLIVGITVAIFAMISDTSKPKK